MVVLIGIGLHTEHKKDVMCYSDFSDGEQQEIAYLIASRISCMISDGAKLASCLAYIYDKENEAYYAELPDIRFLGV